MCIYIYSDVITIRKACHMRNPSSNPSVEVYGKTVS